MQSQSISAPAAPAPDAAAPPELFGYRPEAGVYDEMMEADGTIRPHWQAFANQLAKHTLQELRERKETMQRLLRDHGVTFNVFDDAQGTSRPWELDLLPLLIPSDEWRAVAEGLAQRAELLNQVLADIYGPQRLVKEGWIPPALLHANPGYLRAANGIDPTGGRFLITMGTDLVRDQNGYWVVLADRTQAPSGKGYTLENRTLLTSVLPEEFNVSHVRRLAAFYDVERETFRQWAPARRKSPLVVMLTPGPYSETYFEHAFKARHLGIALVEGADLTVRDRQLFLKTLEGLRRVDVLVRRVDESYCDPLELRADTWLGVAGLMEAWRAGNVTVVNGIGSGAVETPALHPFLPGICRTLLGEELKLGGIATWWCGQPRELAMVLEEPRKWVLKPAFADGRRDPIFLDQLDDLDLKVWVERLRAEPHAWVARETLQLSTAPTWVGDRLQPRPVVWRAYAIAGPHGTEIMPGGLSRVSSDPRRYFMTMRGGSISKDTWVTGEGPEPPPPPKEPLVIRPARSPGAVPSRAADHLYWLGRYAERLEQTVRVLRTLLQRLSGERTEVQQQELRTLVRLLTGLSLAPEELGQEFSLSALNACLRELLYDSETEGSVPELLGRMRYNAAAARDRLSDDTWRLINRLERHAKVKRGGLAVATAVDMLDSLILDLAAFSGMMLENMTRGHGWRFLEAGRRLERGLGAATALKIGTKTAAQDESILAPLLEIFDSSMTYRRMHFARPSIVPVVDLLLLNESNPRSAAFQLQALGRLSRHLPADPTFAKFGEEKTLCDGLLSEMAGLNFPALAAKESLALKMIPPFCDKLIEGLEELSSIITVHYFSHAMGISR